jgi:hypothetical protein
VRSLAARFGGSHAQRDAIDLTLIEAALRAKDARLSAALAQGKVEKTRDFRQRSGVPFRRRRTSGPEFAPPL